MNQNEEIDIAYNAMMAQRDLLKGAIRDSLYCINKDKYVHEDSQELLTVIGNILSNALKILDRQYGKQTADESA